MYREAFESLQKWQKSKNRKPLILRGARQVGKTWLLQEFGKENYDSVVYLNMENITGLADIFALDLDPRRVIRAIENLKSVKIEPEKTLVIFDEIQEIPRALTALKYFCEEAPEYHVAASGSLLGVALHEGTSFPVGKVEFVDILPMNFYEFLRANGKEGLAEALKTAPLEEMAAYHSTLIEDMRTYMVVGGMPEAVKTYVEGGNFDDVRAVQRRIVDAYEVDFSKHAPLYETPRIREIYNSIPTFLSRENKKFVFGAIRESARAREYEMALLWTEDTGLAAKVKRVNAVKLPLAAYAATNAFKLFISDIGLLGAKLQVDPAVVVNSNDLFEEYKGAFAEQFVFQELKAAGITAYYYSNDDSKGEIDFLIEGAGAIVPLEVKSGKNLKSVSFKNFIEKWKLERGVKFSVLPYKHNEKVENLPLYLAARALG